MATIVETIRQVEPSPDSIQQGQGQRQRDSDGYRYAHLLPHFSPQTYPPLTPFEHSDPALRALSHPNPRSFLDNATSVIELTPNLGTEVRGVSLAQLDSDGRDQLAFEVQRHFKFPPYCVVTVVSGCATGTCRI
jgi:sulfonate dioxygenase